MQTLKIALLGLLAVCAGCKTAPYEIKPYFFSRNTRFELKNDYDETIHDVRLKVNVYDGYRWWIGQWENVGEMKPMWAIPTSYSFNLGIQAVEIKARAREGRFHAIYSTDISRVD